MKVSDKGARPDLADGIDARKLEPGDMLAGRVGEKDVLLARSGDEFFAVGARCTHYRGALADGLIVGDTVRCPLHHACFSLRNGRGAARARRSIPSRAGRWSVGATWCSCREQARRRRLDPSPARRRASARDRSSSSVAAPRDCRRRHAAPRRLRGADHDDQRRRRSAGGPAEPVEGLPRGRGSGRLDADQAGRVPSSERRHRSGCKARECRRSIAIALESSSKTERGLRLARS